MSKFLPDQVKAIDHQYIGPKPPDKDYDYLITVCALDTIFELEKGFYLNQLMTAIEGHFLDNQKIKL